jgi:GNAT superfamily N-acetyltransferase
LWVALNGDVPVGFAHVTELEGDAVHLQEIDVHPAHAQRGLGTALVLEVCNWAADTRRSVTLTTFRDVAWNMPFYAGLGFDIVPDTELSPALQSIVDDEVRRGLDRSRRVVMRRPWRARSFETATAAEAQFIEDQVNAENCRVTGFYDARELVILLRHRGGRIYAGLTGHTWGGAAEVRFLWVDAPRRGAGIGSGLLRAAEREARARGCEKMVLSTHSFQAADFYLKHQYTVAGEVADYPRGHRQMYLEKSLRVSGHSRDLGG